MTDARIQTGLNWVASKIGTREGFANGHWNNIEPFVNDPGMSDLAWAQGQPWCAVYTSDYAIHCGLRDAFPHTASVPAAVAWAKANGCWSEYPAVGALMVIGNEEHIGVCIGYDATYAWLNSGNTNTDGGAEGYEVAVVKWERRSTRVLGYILPKGVPVTSADPSYRSPVGSAFVPPAQAKVQMLGDDYSFTHPAIAALKAAGVTAVGRYLSDYAAKNITAAEAAALHAAGIMIWLVWENRKGDALLGAAQGAEDARKALAQADALGIPTNVPIYLATDTDATWAQVQAYYAGARTVLGARVGVYGSYKVTVAARAAGYLFTWQTEAWSVAPDGVSRLHDPNANVIQLVKATHPVAGTDENVIQHPHAMWSGSAAPKPLPAPPEPALVRQARLALAQYIPTANAGTYWGRRARRSYNEIRGIAA